MPAASAGLGAPRGSPHPTRNGSHDAFKALPRALGTTHRSRQWVTGRRGAWTPQLCRLQILHCLSSQTEAQGSQRGVGMRLASGWRGITQQKS